MAAIDIGVLAVRDLNAVGGGSQRMAVLCACYIGITAKDIAGRVCCRTALGNMQGVLVSRDCSSGCGGAGNISLAAIHRSIGSKRCIVKDNLVGGGIGGIGRTAC